VEIKEVLELKEALERVEIKEFLELVERCKQHMEIKEVSELKEVLERVENKRVLERVESWKQIHTFSSFNAKDRYNALPLESRKRIYLSVKKYCIQSTDNFNKVEDWYNDFSQLNYIFYNLGIGMEEKRKDNYSHDGLRELFEQHYNPFLKEALERVEIKEVLELKEALERVEIKEFLELVERCKQHMEIKEVSELKEVLERVEIKEFLESVESWKQYPVRQLNPFNAKDDYNALPLESRKRIYVSVEKYCIRSTDKFNDVEDWYKDFSQFHHIFYDLGIEREKKRVKQAPTPKSSEKKS